MFELLAKVIPAAGGVPVRGSEGAEPFGIERPADGEDRGGWGIALEALQLMERNSWPSLKETMAMGEGLEFAKTVHRLGEKSNCRPVTEYGQALWSAVEHFKIFEMESQLAAFPKLVSQLKVLVENP